MHGTLDRIEALKTLEFHHDAFLSAYRLGITKRERAGLIGVLKMLEGKEFKYIEDYLIPYRRAKKDHKYFNMGGWSDDVVTIKPGNFLHTCGSVCCMAGWSDRLFKTRFVNKSAGYLRERSNKDVDNVLTALFAPSDYELPHSIELCDIKPAQAARCLRHYLTKGIVDWRRAIRA